MKLLILCLLISFNSYAEQKEEVPIDKDLKFSILSFISNISDVEDNKLDNNKFQIRRAYLDFRKSVTSYMDFRLTYDTYEDDDGNEQRIKYLYALFKVPGFGMVDKLRFKVGIIHNPWLEYQSQFYQYRLQGHLFAEKSGLFDSADFGITMYGDLNEPGDGPKIADYTIGVYNGTGYKGFPINPDRAFQTRIGIMPLWRAIPEWKVGLYYLNGKSNIDDIEKKPKWETKSVYSAYEHKYFTLTGEYVFGTGNQFGSLLNENQKPLDFEGYSVFLELKPINDFSVIARYDNFQTVDKSLGAYDERFIGGIAYFINKSNIVLLDYEHEFENELTDDPVHRLKATLQIQFRDIIKSSL